MKTEWKNPYAQTQVSAMVRHLRDRVEHPRPMGDSYQSVEIYDYTVPRTFLGFHIGNRKLGAEELAERLDDGLPVTVFEHRQVRSSDKGHHVYYKDRVDTTLNSVDDLHVFTRINTHEDPESDLEKLAQKVDDAHMIPLTGGPGRFLQVAPFRQDYYGGLKLHKPVNDLTMAQLIKQTNDSGYQEQWGASMAPVQCGRWGSHVEKETRWLMTEKTLKTLLEPTDKDR